VTEATIAPKHMNPERTKLRQHEELQQSEALAAQAGQQQGQEFSTVEELLRFDSDQTPVPADVAARLNAAIAAEPRPARPWYKSLFG
jgi:negative regulator of sigma E activity